MSQSQTSGYDLIVQLSEQELNNQMQTAFVLAPFSFNIGVITVNVQPSFNHLELDVIPATQAIDNCVRLFVDFDVTSNAGIQLTATAEIDAPITVVPLTATQRQLRIVFNSDPNMPLVTIVSSSMSVPGSVTNNIRDYLHNTVQYYDIGPSVDLLASSDPLAPTDVHVKVVDDPNPLGIDCISILLNTGGSTGGNPNGVTHYVGTVPTGAIVVLSNQLLLERLIRPALENQLSATFNPPCVLASPVLIYEFRESRRIAGIKFTVDIEIYLQSMEVHVEDDHLRVTGSFGGSGSGWSASGGFSARLYFDLANGVISVRQETDSMHGDFDFKWWVWVLMGLTMGGLGVLITAIAQYAINRIIDKAMSSLGDLASQLGSVSVPTIPLGPGGGQLTITNVLLDDLTLQGPVNRIPASAAALSLRGDLVRTHTQTQYVVNGATVSKMQFMSANAGLPYTITRKFTYRGVFSAVASQPLMPVSFEWSLAGVHLAGSGPQSVNILSGSQVVQLHYQLQGANCWVWTDAGTEIANQMLVVIMTDGAGHASSAYVTLSRIGGTTESGTTQGLQMASDIGVINVVFTSDDGTDGTVISVTDRSQELRNALEKGLVKKETAKGVPKAAAKAVTSRKAAATVRKTGAKKR